MLELNNYPIIDKTQGAANVSKHYKTITTRNVIDYFMAHGFIPKKISVANAANDGFQKHVVTFDCPEDFPIKIDGLKPELHVLNSHNAQSSLRISLGVYRLVCSNGLVVGTKFFGARVRHIGNVEENLSKALTDSVNAFDLVAKKINQWQSVKLTPEQAFDFARRAAQLRIPKNTETHTYSINETSIGRLLVARRDADLSTDLFTVFNTLQEKLIQRPETSYVRYSLEKIVIDTPVSFPRIERSKRRFGRLTEISKLRENAKLWDLTEQFYAEVA